MIRFQISLGKYGAILNGDFVIDRERDHMFFYMYLKR